MGISVGKDVGIFVVAFLVGERMDVGVSEVVIVETVVSVNRTVVGTVVGFTVFAAVVIVVFGTVVVVPVGAVVANVVVLGSRGERTDIVLLTVVAS